MFRQRSQVDEWFRYIIETKPLTIKFDAYYLCAMVGLVSKRKAPVDDATDLVQRYPQAYQHARYGLLSLLLSAEMAKQGIQSTDRNSVERLIREYVNPEDQTSLSKTGFDAMNQYASGGFNVLAEREIDPPRDLPSFLIAVSALIQEFSG